MKRQQEHDSLISNKKSKLISLLHDHITLNHTHVNWHGEWEVTIEKDCIEMNVLNTLFISNASSFSSTLKKKVSYTNENKNTKQ